MTDRSRILSTLRRALPWLALVAAVVWASGGVKPTAHFPVGSRLPAFSARLADGGAFSLPEAPQRVVILSFWASYCGPCRAEAPLLSGAAASDVRVVGLSVEDAMPLAEIARQAQALGMHYPVGSADRVLLELFQVGAVPTTYVIARDGVIVMSRVGAVSRSELEAALATARRRSG